MRAFFGILFAIIFGLTLHGWIFGVTPSGVEITGNEPATAGIIFVFVGVPCGLLAAWLLRPFLFGR